MKNITTSNKLLNIIDNNWFRTYPQFKQCLMEEIARARRYKTRFTVAGIALVPEYKRNGQPDNYYNYIIKEVARILDTVTRTVDIVGECGNNRLGILMPSTTNAEAKLAYERIKQHIEYSLKTGLNGEKVKMSCRGVLVELKSNTPLAEVDHNNAKHLLKLIHKYIDKAVKTDRCIIKEKIIE